MSLFQPPGNPMPRLGQKRGRPSRSKSKTALRKGKKWAPTTNKRERLEQMAVNGLGTLPERLVEFGLIKLGYNYRKQLTVGNSLVIGGGIVDFIVYFGAPPGVAIRVQGDYWHSMMPRRAKDRIQYQRLINQGYRVWDAWEGDIYDAALGGYLISFVREGVESA